MVQEEKELQGAIVIDNNKSHVITTKTSRKSSNRTLILSRNKNLNNADLSRVVT